MRDHDGRLRTAHKPRRLWRGSVETHTHRQFRSDRSTLGNDRPQSLAQRYERMRGRHWPLILSAVPYDVVDHYGRWQTASMLCPSGSATKAP